MPIRYVSVPSLLALGLQGHRARGSREPGPVGRRPKGKPSLLRRGYYQTSGTIRTGDLLLAVGLQGRRARGSMEPGPEAGGLRASPRLLRRGTIQ